MSNEITIPQIPEKIAHFARFPTRRGAIFQMEADDKGLALADAKVGSLKVYVLVDPDNGQILDTKFFTYGGPALTAFADILCNYLAGKNVDALKDLSEDKLKELFVAEIFSQAGNGENSEEAAANQIFTEFQTDFDAIVKLPAALYEIYPEKKQIALAMRAAMGSAKLKAFTAEGRKEADDEWNALSDDEKLRRIEESLNDGIRAMLAGDGGGLEIVEIKDGKKVVIRYQGACVGCGAASGGTLYYIEDQLQQNVYYGITVEPEF